MNKIIYSILTLFLLSVMMNTLSGCEMMLLPEESHHYVHIVSELEDFPSEDFPIIPRGAEK